jgi:hypothetical protein
LRKALPMNPLFLLMFAMSALFIGAAFVYISIKAPFYWGGAFLPGVLLLIVFAIAAIMGAVSILRRPVRASS